MTVHDYDGLMPQDGPLAGRYVFYNRSAFDGNSAAASAADDAAIETDSAADTGSENYAKSRTSTARSTVIGERSHQVGVLRNTSRSPQLTETWL